MNEAAPAPARPPVPGWERVAAGVLLGIWIMWFVSKGIPFSDWWGIFLATVASTQQAWTRFIAPALADRPVLIDSTQLLEGVIRVLWVAVELTRPFVILGGLIVASGLWRWRGRRWFWWLTLGHGGMAFLSVLVARRAYALSFVSSQSLPWYEGWIWSPQAVPWRYVFDNVWPYYAEMFLATLVLTLTWWRRRRAKAEASAAAVGG